MYADRLKDIAPFRVMELMERAKSLERDGHHVVHFEVGEPDFPTAAPVVAAGQRALAAGHTKYTQALGIPELRERIAAYYEDVVGVRISPQRIVVTSGASGGLLMLCALLLNPGDELLMADPGYPCNEVFARLVSGCPRRLPVAAETGFQVQPPQIEAQWSAAARGLLLASPANPTGAVIPRAALEALVATTHGLGGVVVLDEIYQGLIYADQPSYRSGLEIHDDIHVLNSFSKYYGMTGWRLGWMVVPEAAIDSITPLAQNLFISPSAIAQHAALEAFDAPAVAVHEERRALFARRRDLLAEGLKALGFQIPVAAAGAFYLYVDISHTGMDSQAFCWRLIDEFKVAVTPGIDFGDNAAERFVRFAYTTGEENIDLGLQRIAQALNRWKVACA